MKKVPIWLLVGLLAVPAAVRAQEPAQATAGRDGFSLKSADNDFVLKVRGYVHFDGRFFLDEEQRPAIDTFTLRRVRPIFEGTLYKIFDFRIMPARMRKAGVSRASR